MKRLFYLLLFTHFQILAQTDTITIYFDIGKFEVSSEELQKLQVDKADWQKVDIVSYTDYLGNEQMNKQLSIDRSREVRARLVQYGLNTTTLGVVEGKGIAGETLNTLDGIQKNRRTDIVIFRSIPKISVIEETDTIKRKIPTVVKKVELKSQIDSASVGDQLVLSNMIFLPGQHFLTKESLTSYKELFQTMSQNPGLRIKIEGHICCKIDNEDGLDLATNQFNLSEARAKYIYDLLIYDGIAKNRLAFEGFARNTPLFPYERTEEEKTANRRVEIRILEK